MCVSHHVDAITSVANCAERRVQNLPSHLRWKTADAPTMFSIYAHHWDLAHPAERLAAQCPVQASSHKGSKGNKIATGGNVDESPGEKDTLGTAGKDSVGDKDLAGAQATKETERVNGRKGRKGRGARKGKQGVTGGSADEKGKVDLKARTNTVLRVRSTVTKRGGKCEPRWPKINWAQFLQSSH